MKKWNKIKNITFSIHINLRGDNKGDLFEKAYLDLIATTDSLENIFYR